MEINRRKLFGLGTGTLGSLVLGQMPAMAASSSDLQSLIISIVYRNFPQSVASPELVEQFADSMLRRELSIPEDEELLTARGQVNREVLERFVLVEFMTSAQASAIFAE